LITLIVIAETARSARFGVAVQIQMTELERCQGLNEATFAMMPVETALKVTADLVAVEVTGELLGCEINVTLCLVLKAGLAK
jgi:hypothetical protein